LRGLDPRIHAVGPPLASPAEAWCFNTSGAAWRNGVDTRVKPAQGVVFEDALFQTIARQA
jgi:hypothetical protein